MAFSRVLVPARVGSSSSSIASSAGGWGCLCLMQLLLRLQRGLGDSSMFGSVPSSGEAACSSHQVCRRGRGTARAHAASSLHQGRRIKPWHQEYSCRCEMMCYSGHHRLLHI
jgi:hypothetical protein